MIVKKIYVKDMDTCINNILKLFATFNIRYVFIKQKDFFEMHFDNYIFKAYASMENKNIMDIINAIYEKHNIIILRGMFESGNANMVDQISFHSHIDENDTLGEIHFIDDKLKRSGFKKYSKKDIRNDNIKINARR